ncbi:AraC family transcriptional regulator [uncultured Desulfuromusa sp.]|uniref:AraC family transcriptional regulator n=1 Tax=uncultured Desulfuromusa sp. TaxID=219183 RepID=UPI002AA9563F|nr:AraC family transcriptional regulator [uncultured Desulfuromusa sp.]
MKTIQLGSPVATAIPNNFRIDLPTDHGQGSFNIDCFASGLKLCVMKTAFTEPHYIQNISTEPTVGFGFCLVGKLEAQVSCINTPFMINTGDSGFFAFPKAVEMTEKVSKGCVLRVHLMLEGESLAMLAHGDEDPFLPALQSLDHHSACRIGDTTTPVMKAILQQLLHCPYCGSTRKLFIEAKAMELLAHKLEQLHPCGHAHDCSTAVKTADKEHVHHAAHILVSDLESPPDMNTLARSVGLSRSKLHRCFHKVYGCSPFDYLRQQRLQTAMLLLQHGEVNVTEAALTVGYTNLSYFAKAFKSAFGIAPGELRKFQIAI